MKKLVLFVLLGLVFVACVAPSGVECPPCPTCPSIHEAEVPTPSLSSEKPEVEIVDMTFKRDSIGNFIVMGILRNNGNATARGLEITCMGYDSNDHLVDTNMTYPDVTTLKVGGETAYTCYLDEVSPIKEYKCQVRW